MLDLFANCIAIFNRPQMADFMAFKYFSPWYLRMADAPDIPAKDQEKIAADSETH